MRFVALLLVTLGFGLSPLVFDDRVATWPDVLPRGELVTTASRSPKRSPFAVDSAGQTHWTGRWESGEWLRIDFGRLVPLLGVTLDNGQVQDNHPRMLDVLTVQADRTRRRDAFEFEGKRFRMWQEYRAEAPVPALGVILRPSLNIAGRAGIGALGCARRPHTHVGGARLRRGCLCSGVVGSVVAVARCAGAGLVRAGPRSSRGRPEAREGQRVAADVRPRRATAR